MSIYVLKAFDKNTKGEGIDNARLCTAAAEIMAGQYEASLGGGVYKKRIPLKKREKRRSKGSGCV